MKIIPPYVSDEFDVHYEIIKNHDDFVERSGYVPPDVKIAQFVESGQLLQEYHAGGDNFDIQGSESDFDQDSPEYREELENDAENYTGAILPQFIDSISACETMDNMLKSNELKASESTEKQRKKSAKDAENESLLSKLSDSVAQKVIEASKTKEV